MYQYMNIAKIFLVVILLFSIALGFHNDLEIPFNSICLSIQRKCNFLIKEEDNFVLVNHVGDLYGPIDKHNSVQEGNILYL